MYEYIKHRYEPGVQCDVLPYEICSCWLSDYLVAKKHHLYRYNCNHHGVYILTIDVLFLLYWYSFINIHFLYILLWHHWPVSLFSIHAQVCFLISMQTKIRTKRAGSTNFITSFYTHCIIIVFIATIRKVECNLHVCIKSSWSPSDALMRQLTNQQWFR